MFFFFSNALCCHNLFNKWEPGFKDNHNVQNMSLGVFLVHISTHLKDDVKTYKDYY